MKQIVLLLCSVALAAVLASCASSGLPSFGMDQGVQSNPIPGGEPMRVPYTDMKSYYGYVKPGSAPDAEVGGKKMYYIYVWIPLAAPELGMRMVSPTPQGMSPGKDDFQSSNYAEAKSDTKSFFDTWITLDRALEVLTAEDIATKGTTTTWTNYGANDDSSELPAQPSGNKYNSVLRVTSDLSDPLKSLVRGLYRVGFTTYKVGEVQGSFLAQLGAPVKLPGVVVGKTLEDVAKTAK